ncbi:ABC transporter ATP-binding protein YtrB [Botrimarina colliarenosi]|uniref:ABC transporter ATP-binding protein YtrB n=1 Tax=Botrimarina colliarenosi TaxID=2528001 RepID=A0A5C6AM78_9BACT|nr:ABC transporter ATP-binding protein [Botrimarina colliarenosi]TWU00521.1 ABC transporter ATP-binding protein YtrB [Botrimarina colliarenosi]
MTTPLEARSLIKAFDGDAVLKGVDLTVEPGTVLGLLGKNGSGKSTLIKCLLGLLKPTAGEAFVFGEDAWSLSAAAKGRLGYVPQEVVTYPWMRVRQVIAYTGAFYPTWNQRLADDLCRRWNLPLEQRAGVLSVGQLQTLGLVLALGHEPELLVLDEPVASLDPSARREFLRILIEITGDGDDAGGRVGESARPRTVLFSTHITSDLERIASRLALLKDGAIAFEGESDALKERVKRIRLTSRNGALPTGIDIPGAIHTTVEGVLAEATVTDFTPDLPARLAAENNVDVAVVDLNLEEIFVEMHDE